MKQPKSSNSPNRHSSSRKKTSLASRSPPSTSTQDAAPKSLPPVKLSLRIPSQENLASQSAAAKTAGGTGGFRIKLKLNPSGASIQDPTTSASPLPLVASKSIQLPPATEEEDDVSIDDAPYSAATNRSGQPISAASSDADAAERTSSSTKKQKKRKSIFGRVTGPSKRKKDSGEDVVEYEVKKQPQRKKPLYSFLEQNINQLIRKDSYGLFSQPVDTTVITDYVTVIKEPMDFGTMKIKVEKKGYKSLEEYRRDFDLVCKNAKTYNAPETIYYKLADKIQEFGQRMLDKNEEFIEPLDENQLQDNVQMALVLEAANRKLEAEGDEELKTEQNGEKREKRPYNRKNVSKFEFWPDGTRFDMDERYLIPTAPFPFCYAYEAKEEEDALDYDLSTDYLDFGPYFDGKMTLPSEDILTRTERLFGDLVNEAFISSLQSFVEDLPSVVQQYAQNRVKSLSCGVLDTIKHVQKVLEQPEKADPSSEFEQLLLSISERLEEHEDALEWDRQILSVLGDKVHLEWLTEAPVDPSSKEDTSATSKKEKAAERETEKRIRESLPPLPLTVHHPDHVQMYLNANDVLLQHLLNPPPEDQETGPVTPAARSRRKSQAAAQVAAVDHEKIQQTRLKCFKHQLLQTARLLPITEISVPMMPPSPAMGGLSPRPPLPTAPTTAPVP